MYFGVAELLELLASVINGFAMPLREEHRTLLRRVLLPLHTGRHLGVYQSHLLAGLLHFIELDADTANIIVHGDSFE